VKDLATWESCSGHGFARITCKITGVRILWVKAGKLLPVDTGGKIRSYRILKELERGHTVSLLSYYNGKRDLEYEAAIQAELPGAHSICTGMPDASVVGESVYYLRRLSKSAPFAVTKFAHGEVRNLVTALLGARRFDIAVCDFLAASSNFGDGLQTPVILFQHNVETVLWQRMASREKNPAKRLVYRIEAAKMKRYESAALARFDHVVAVSERDQQWMLEMSPNSAISVVPTGADTPPAMPAAAEASPAKIVFTGSMDWEPNIDGVEFFCREIFPRVRNEFPQVIFQIVGRNPAAQVKRLASASVEVTGAVASVEDYVRDATVMVVPLRIGGGTRLKIFEAMARGKAVVSTTIGAEGLDVQNGRDLILADDPANFAGAICRLLRDGATRRKYEQAGVACAVQHSWTRVAKRFEDILQRTVEAWRPDYSDRPLAAAM